MALQLGALYAALRGAVEGTITEEQARLAAEEVAAYDNRMAAIERNLTLLQWMVGTLGTVNIGLTIMVLGHLLSR